jgi:branched-chain amino acid aminotransferase
MAFADRDGFIWMDGELVDWRDAQIHFLTSSLHYGTGVFEGIRAYETDAGTCIFRLEDHVRRLFNSAKILHLNIPYTEEEVSEAIREVVRVNNLKEAYIRPASVFGI